MWSDKQINQPFTKWFFFNILDSDPFSQILNVGLMNFYSFPGRSRQNHI